MVKVAHYQRSVGVGFSIERVFADVRDTLPPDIKVRLATCRFHSRGVLRRVYNVFEAVWRQGEVNHILGDVHYLALLLSRRRTLLTILDCVSLERLRGWRYWAMWLIWYWLPMKRAGMITVISEATREGLLRHGLHDGSRALVVHCCVSPAFAFDSRKLDFRCPRILQVGTGTHKNLDRLAHALEGLPCRLVVIGRLSARQASALKMHGIDVENRVGLSANEIVEEYRRADMVVFVSTYEGFGLPIVEAQAVGRPVVTSRLHSMPEVAGEGACLVDPYDAAHIRSGILRVINDSEYRQFLIEAGRRNVRRFSAPVVADQYAAIYRRMSEGG